MKQSLKHRFGAGNHEEQIQYQPKKHFIELNSISCAIPRVDGGHLNNANYVSYVLGIEDKGRNMEKELGAILKDLPISLSLYPSLICYEVSLVGLELFLESIFLTIMNNASIESIVVCFGLDGALFDILHDKCLGKFVENVGYVSSFLDTFMETHNDLVSLNQPMSFEFLLKDFENLMGVNLELLKVNPLAFEKSNLRKEAFKQVWKDFVVGHLYYHRPFKE
ncbi:hypothetical protein M9H77_16864 [Catharanthus roseus]|uniref:Uncharacterized protein n=1 Tax=Catharanthus roseus TaxID=4058 RepID=A0ACC0B301_CATRO|nr:hypothetical protein M9H77_16864 [Catharanthus roseus]